MWGDDEDMVLTLDTQPPPCPPVLCFDATILRLQLEEARSNCNKSATTHARP
jgi:hypothetical protein